MGRTILPAILLFLALTLGCGGGGSSEPVNSIKIENVDLASASAEITIRVSYDLQTAENAVIVHCYLDNYFSDRSGNSWMGCPASITDRTVNRGQGTITITDTGALAGINYLSVYLVPNSDSAVGVVSDVQTITIPFP